MGRHRRSAAGRAATGRATGVTQHDGFSAGGRDPLGAHTGDRPTMGIAPYLNPEAYAETYARSEAYLYATDGDRSEAGETAVPAGDGFRDTGFDSGFGGFRDSGFRDSGFKDVGFRDAGFGAGPADDGYSPDGGAPRSGGHRRRKKKAATPVRTGLLGVSAAVALGTVAVATGTVPGLENYRLGGGSGAGDTVEAADTPTNSASEQGGTSGSLESPGRDAGAPASRDAERSTSPEPSPSASSAAPTTTPEQKEPTAPPSEKEPERQAPPRKAAPEKPEKAEQPEAPVTVSAEAAAGAQVLRLVNEERAKAGCSPVAANSALTDLAASFSEDMARRGFFDHTDPDGDTPWDRAKRAGITGLGGENIARGQADAEAVVQAWMNSPGHRANILNCDFKTLGVGVHFGSGGPWWTQNFGY
ncbi:CAP domain-containing protein [Streptomyces sp. NPDC005931]|uniref:CAP domain-containing protein n=1 Tax=Streptomyces sp. NPDC005931 TaxID=3364737 RepID=UPI00367F0613